MLEKPFRREGLAEGILLQSLLSGEMGKIKLLGIKMKKLFDRWMMSKDITIFLLSLATNVCNGITAAEHPNFLN